MNKKRSSLLLAAVMVLMAGCDVPWQTLGAVAAVASGEPALALAVASLDNDANDSWWDRNDEHLDWQFFPFN